MSVTTESSATQLQYDGRDLEALCFAENYYRWMLGEFAPFVQRRILEVGAGSGTLTERLLQYQPERIVSLEPSENMFPHLRSKYAGSPVVETRGGYLSDCIAELRGQFDTVVYVNVLEHVPDDAAEMRHAVDSLNPGGHLLIFVPALPMLYGTADELFGHYRRYTKQSLMAALEGHELDIVRFRYFDVAGIAPWWLAFVVLRRSFLSPGMVKVYDRLVVPWASRLERMTESWPAGKNLLCVARKRS